MKTYIVFKPSSRPPSLKEIKERDENKEKLELQTISSTEDSTGESVLS